MPFQQTWLSAMVSLIFGDVLERLSRFGAQLPTMVSAPFTAPGCGRSLRAGEREPFIGTGAPVVFIGAQYLVPIAYDGSTFTALPPFAVFRITRNAVPPETQDTRSRTTCHTPRPTRSPM